MPRNPGVLIANMTSALDNHGGSQQHLRGDGWLNPGAPGLQQLLPQALPSVVHLSASSQLLPPGYMASQVIHAQSALQPLHLQPLQTHPSLHHQPHAQLGHMPAQVRQHQTLAQPHSVMLGQTWTTQPDNGLQMALATIPGPSEGLGVEPLRMENKGLKRLHSSVAEPIQSKPDAGNSGPVSSRYHGVTWYKASRRWQARLCTGRKQYHLGYYRSEEEAARAFDRAVVQHAGVRGSTQLNFPEEAASLAASVLPSSPLNSNAAGVNSDVNGEGSVHGRNNNAALNSLAKARGMGMPQPHSNEGVGLGESHKRLAAAHDSSRAGPRGNTSIRQLVQSNPSMDMPRPQAWNGAATSNGVTSTQPSRGQLVAPQTAAEPPGSAPRSPTLPWAAAQQPQQGMQLQDNSTQANAGPSMAMQQALLMAMTMQQPTALPQPTQALVANLPSTPSSLPVSVPPPPPAANQLSDLVNTVGCAVVPGVFVPERGEFIPTGSAGVMQIYEHVWDGSRLVLKNVIVGVLNPQLQQQHIYQQHEHGAAMVGRACSSGPSSSGRTSNAASPDNVPQTPKEEQPPPPLLTTATTADDMDVDHQAPSHQPQERVIGRRSTDASGAGGIAQRSVDTSVGLDIVHRSAEDRIGCFARFSAIADAGDFARHSSNVSGSGIVRVSGDDSAAVSGGHPSSSSPSAAQVNS